MKTKRAELENDVKMTNRKPLKREVKVFKIMLASG